LSTTGAPRIRVITSISPWFEGHAQNVVVREDEIMEPLGRFFQRRIFGDGRELLLTGAVDEPVADDSTAALTQEITALQQRQNNLVAELEQFEPSGNDEFDKAWRSGIQDRFRAILAEVKEKQTRLTKLANQRHTQPAANPALFEAIPQANIDIWKLPEERRRRLFDAFHLDLRYDELSHELAIRVTITGGTASKLGATVEALLITPEGTVGILCVPNVGHPADLKRKLMISMWIFRVPGVGHATDLNQRSMISVRMLRVPGAGLEPARLFEAAAFKAAVSAIPPPGRRLTPYRLPPGSWHPTSGLPRRPFRGLRVARPAGSRG
jgi:hypothetical protein